MLNGIAAAYVFGILTAFVFVILGCKVEAHETKKLRYKNRNIRLKKNLYEAKENYWREKNENCRYGA